MPHWATSCSTSQLPTFYTKHKHADHFIDRHMLHENTSLMLQFKHPLNGICTPIAPSYSLIVRPTRSFTSFTSMRPVQQQTHGYVRTSPRLRLCCRAALWLLRCRLSLSWFDSFSCPQRTWWHFLPLSLSWPFTGSRWGVATGGSDHLQRLKET